MDTEERIDYRKATPEVLYQMRRMVVSMYKKKKTVEEMIEVTGFCERTIRQIIRDYKRGGMAALKPKTRGRKAGEKRTLTPAQEKEIVRIITEKNPDQLKMKCCLWTRDAVRQLIREKYGINMPIRTIGLYLQRWGFTVQRPAKQAIEQKPEAVQRWLKEEYPAIHAQAKKEGAEIFWGDETAVQNVPNYARGYAPKGHTPVLKIKARKMHINMISAISNQGKLYFMFSQESINQQKLIEFLERLLKDIQRKVYIILDNLKVHHGIIVAEWVEEHKNHICLFFLPSYSPEYNPDEYLNNDLKQSIGSQRQARTEADLQQNADAFMTSLVEDPKHVQSYFDHPTLAPYRKLESADDENGNI
jgi:transposase